MATKKPQKKTKTPVKKPTMSIADFFSRFHAVIFFVVVCGSLTAMVYMLNSVITTSSAPADYRPPSTSASFDTKTIDQVEQLRGLDEAPGPFALPSGRNDPFPQ